MTLARRPGQPLAVLLALVGGWIVLRIALWQPPFALAASGLAGHVAIAGASPLQAERAEVWQPVRREPERGAPWRAPRRPSGPAALALPVPRIAAASPRASFSPTAFIAEAVRASPPSPDPARRFAGADIDPRFGMPLPRPLTTPRGPPTGRVSGDAWLMLRPGSRGALVAAPFVARYGASQAGAVVRYRLAGSGHRPALYARTTAAIDPLTDRELAIGFAARPLARLPLRAQVEMRARHAGGSVEIAPAVLAVSEVPRLALPLALEAEPYFAAGYVAGRQSTPFVDGSLRIERRVAQFGAADLRLGTGAWGGAQRGAAALDLGPGATLTARLGEQPLRLSLDYRLRVAGGAEPRSGVALTVSTGF